MKKKTKTKSLTQRFEESLDQTLKLAENLKEQMEGKKSDLENDVQEMDNAIENMDSLISDLENIDVPLLEL